MITIKKMGKFQSEVVSDFFTASGKEDLIYDTTGVKEHEIFESLRNYIERVKIMLLRMASPTTISSQMRILSTNIESLRKVRTSLVWRGEQRRPRRKMKEKLRLGLKDKS